MTSHLVSWVVALYFWVNYPPSPFHLRRNGYEVKKFVQKLIPLDRGSGMKPMACLLLKTENANKIFPDIPGHDIGYQLCFSTTLIGHK